MRLKVNKEFKPWPKLTTLLPIHCAFTIDDVVTCNICLEDNDGLIQGKAKRRLITSCGHIFHKSCLEQWAKASNKGSLCGLISCPSCRGEVISDHQTSQARKQLFDALALCNCCSRHQRERPLSYAYDPDLDARTSSKAQEEALNTLSYEEYEVWCDTNSWRRMEERAWCGCHCRRRMRSMVRRIPPPSPYTTIS